MEKVVLYSILSNEQALETWIHPEYRKSLSALSDKIVKRVSSGSSVLIKKLHMEGCWVYYFSQDEFLFILAAVGPEVSPLRLSGSSA
jgi:phage pi2 protein 07